MSNTDEPTEKLKEPEGYQTKPVMNLILERINEIGDELKAFRQETNVRLDALETGVKSLREDFDAFRKETTENFRRVDKKFENRASWYSAVAP